jgi:hypothetical protein
MTRLDNEGIIRVVLEGLKNQKASKSYDLKAFEHF